MANHHLFFALCLTTLLYIGCRSLQVSAAEHGVVQENTHSSSDPDLGTTPTVKTTKNITTPTPTIEPTKPVPTPNTTTHAPITTTPASNTTTPASNTTTPASSTITPAPSPPTPNTTTIAPTPTPAPIHDRSFDPLSFIGGVILSLGLAAIGYVVYKFYRTRTDPNYRTL